MAVQETAVAEEWKPILGHRGYWVSNLGNVRSKRGILKPQVNKKCGYRQIQFAGRVNRYVGKLVLEAFIGPSDLEVDHRDRNRCNDRLDNLRWATHSENNLNKPLRLQSSSGGVKGVTWSKPRSKWVAQVSRFGKHKTLGYFETIQAAETAVLQYKGLS
jgi:hypothetical protein